MNSCAGRFLAAKACKHGLKTRRVTKYKVGLRYATGGIPQLILIYTRLVLSMEPEIYADEQGCNSGKSM